MKFIVGLGNPGQEYQYSRHNAGFMVIDEIAEKLKVLQFQQQAKFFSEIARSDDIFLVKPQTFMNNSGKAVRAILDFYKASTEDLYVVHDDLDIAVGSYKIQLGTGPKVHNGLKSIYQYLHTENFWHVRIGVDGSNGLRDIPGKDYVLMPFKAEELPVLHEVTAKASQEILSKIQA